MTIRWSTSGYPRSATRRYTTATPGFPGGEWATDQLSSVYDRVYTGMDQMSEQGRRSVRGRVVELDRIDTGVMLASTFGGIIPQGESIEITFGWYDGAPFYAIFQEFGTSRGITPMKAVHRAFWEAHDALKALIGA